jgi:hypothetical protein
MTRAALALVLVAACRPAPVIAPAPAPAPAPVAPSAPVPKPATYVVTLEPGVATPVTTGPFIVRAINPGSDLQLGIGKSETCDDAAWFVYSGGGAAVGAGETLCALSRTSEPIPHGFSGYSE